MGPNTLGFGEAAEETIWLLLFQLCLRFSPKSSKEREKHLCLAVTFFVGEGGCGAEWSEGGEVCVRRRGIF